MGDLSRRQNAADLWETQVFLFAQTLRPLKAQSITQTQSHHVLSGSHCYG